MMQKLRSASMNLSGVVLNGEQTASAEVEARGFTQFSHPRFMLFLMRPVA
jgi:hypothetical protein